MQSQGIGEEKRMPNRITTSQSWRWRPGAVGLALLCLLLSDARAADPSAETHGSSTAVDLDAFQGVHIRSAPSGLAYPEGERSRRREGWVRLNMMIDPKGKPYEITVLDSSGNPVLENAAVRA